MKKVHIKSLQGYGMTETGVYVNLKKGTEVGACFSNTGSVFGKPSLNVSPYYALHSNDAVFRAVAGHELIHAIHYSSLGVTALQNLYSERVAYSYTSEIFSSAGRYMDPVLNNNTMLRAFYYGAYPASYNINTTIPFNFFFIR